MMRVSLNLEAFKIVSQQQIGKSVFLIDKLNLDLHQVTSNMYFDFKTLSKAIITKLLDFIANNACSEMRILVISLCRFVYV